MKINRGKDFENVIREGFNNVPNTSVDRLYDTMSGYKGNANICDFIVYHRPTLYYLECKSCYGNTLPWANITQNQWNGLLKKSKISGVIAGYIIWFIEHNETIFLPAQDAEQLKTEFGHKSFNITKWDYGDWYHFKGRKKRIMFEYDMADFLKNINKEY